MKKLMFLFTGCMLVSFITYSKHASSPKSHLSSSPVKGYYSIGNAGHPGGNSVRLESIAAGKDYFDVAVKGYYANEGNGNNLKKHVFQLTAGNKKAVIQKGYYSQVH